MKKLAIALVAILSIALLYISGASAASNADIQAAMINVLYGGSGGYVSCDFDGYVKTPGRHEGIDFAKGAGATVYSLIDGTVIRAYDPGSGLSTISIYDSVHDKSVIYLHTSGHKVSTGQTVTKGQAIAIESNRGASSAHTHVEVRSGSQQYASKSTDDPVLNNENPYPYWDLLYGNGSDDNKDDGRNDGQVTELNSNRIAFTLDKIETIGKKLHLEGWAYDRQNPGAIVTIHVYPGEGVQAFFTTAHRPDVNSAFGLDGTHGFDIYCSVSLVGSYSISVDALYTDNTGAENIIKGTVTYKNEYTIKYNANGGTGAPSAQTKVEGSPITLSSTKPKKEGYVFQGWSTSQNGAVQYSSGSTYAKNSSATLYAIWKEIVYLVTYDANGGENAPDTQEKAYTSDLTITDAIPTRDGYRFLGWAESADATSATYQPGSVLTENVNLELYAVWEKSIFDITFDANGGNVNTTTKTVTYGETYGELPVPARTGHGFIGWFTAKEGGDQITATTQVTNTNVQTLFAHWEPDTYTVTYDANGGSGAPGSQQKIYGVDLQLSTKAPTRENYTFLGWSMNKNDETPALLPGYTYALNKPVTLYAVWKQNTYTVTYDANGGETAAWSEEKAHGEDYTITSVVPAWSGHVFLGWSADKNATTAAYKAGDTYAEDAVITFYAVWSAERIQFEIETFQVSGDTLRLVGWAFDATDPSASISVRLDSGAAVRTYTASRQRDDINATYGIEGAHGFSIVTQTKLNGTYQVTLDALHLDEGSTRLLDETVSYTYTNPIVCNLDDFEFTGNTLHIRGWAFDKDYTYGQVTVMVNTGEGIREFLTESHRPDVNSAYGIDGLHGFDLYIELAKVGKHNVTVDIYNVSHSDSKRVLEREVEYTLVPDFILPSALVRIESEAFLGASFTYAVLPEGVTTIASRAFADCANLVQIYIPENTTSIAADAFTGSGLKVICGASGSYAEFYAGKYGYEFKAQN